MKKAVITLFIISLAACSAPVDDTIKLSNPAIEFSKDGVQPKMPELSFQPLNFEIDFGI